MAILFLDFFGSDPSKMDQTRKFGEQTSQIQAQRAWFLVNHNLFHSGTANFFLHFGTFNTKSVANSNVAVLVQCDHELLPFVLSVLSGQKIFSVDFWNFLLGQKV